MKSLIAIETKELNSKMNFFKTFSIEQKKYKTKQLNKKTQKQQKPKKNISRRISHCISTDAQPRA